jgi:hypothetical protein
VGSAKSVVQVSGPLRADKPDSATLYRTVPGAKITKKAAVIGKKHARRAIDELNAPCNITVSESGSIYLGGPKRPLPSRAALACSNKDLEGGGPIVKKLIGLLVAAALWLGAPDFAVAQAPPAGQSPGEKADSSPEKGDKNMAQTAVGRVKSATSDRLVVIGKSRGQGAEWTFVIEAQTKIRKEGKDVTATDLKPGDGVQVRYLEQDGKYIAQTVRARTAPAEKKP